MSGFQSGLELAALFSTALASQKSEQLPAKRQRMALFPAHQWLKVTHMHQHGRATAAPHGMTHVAVGA